MNKRQTIIHLVLIEHNIGGWKKHVNKCDLFKQIMFVYWCKRDQILWPIHAEVCAKSIFFQLLYYISDCYNTQKHWKTNAWGIGKSFQTSDLVFSPQKSNAFQMSKLCPSIWTSVNLCLHFWHHTCVQGLHRLCVCKSDHMLFGFVYEAVGKFPFNWNATMRLVLQLTSMSENITEAISQNVRHKLMGEGQQRTEEQEGKDRAWEKQYWEQHHDN